MAVRIVHSIRSFNRNDGHDLPPGVNETVKVYIVQKRKDLRRRQNGAVMKKARHLQDPADRGYALYDGWNTDRYHVESVWCAFPV